LAGVKFLLKKERVFFFRGSALQVFGQVAEQCGRSFAKLFFGERICQNFGSFVFEFGCRKWKRRGLGRNFPFAPLFVLGEFGADKKQKIQIQYCLDHFSASVCPMTTESILGIRLGHFR